MSELTPCNYCSLQSMTAEAESRGATVILKIVPPTKVMAGWTSARYSDKRSPSAWFLVLTNKCTC